MSKASFLGVVLLSLTACGFSPIYSDGRDATIQRDLASISVAPISDRVGQQLRNHLLDALNPFGRPQKPRYTLSVKLTETKQELAVRKTELATRANLRFQASFSLIQRGANRGAVFNGDSQIVASYNILNADYATLIAERNARERAVRELSAEITNRLVAFLQLQGAG